MWINTLDFALLKMKTLCIHLNASLWYQEISNVINGDHENI